MITFLWFLETKEVLSTGRDFAPVIRLSLGSMIFRIISCGISYLTRATLSGSGGINSWLHFPCWLKYGTRALLILPVCS